MGCLQCHRPRRRTPIAPKFLADASTPFYLAPNAITYRQIIESDRRDAVFGAIQWQPSDRLDINIDAQYSNRDFSEDRHDLNLSEGRFGITNRVINEDGRYLESYSGLSSLESTSTLLERGEEYKGGGIDIAWKATEQLTVSADASYSRTKRVEISRSTRLRSDPLDIFGNRTPLNNQRIPYTYTIANGFAPTITFDPRFDITNHALFSDDARLRRDQNQRENEIWAGRLDLDYKVDGGFLSQIDAGARYTRLTYKDYRRQQGNHAGRSRG